MIGIYRAETCRALSLALFTVLAVAVAVAGSASAPGVGNFHQVNDRLYRGAQPTEEGFKRLAQLGVRIVMDLRRPEERSNVEQKVVQSLGMRYVHLPMKGRRFPSDADILRALTIFNDSSTTPVFVHCREGKDRTGAVIACYRIAHDGWTNRRALAEAKSYGMHREEHEIQEYIMHFHAPAPPPK
jgi:tyrosine-protein phosphatase SIW14